MMNETIADLLGDNGPVAAVLDGFAPRVEQQHLATAVQQALSSGSLLIGEAGTGTGKTFAYLAPALLSGLGGIIATGTRHLQDQLFHADLPTMQKALTSNARVSLLKGRANYLCRHRLARAGRHPVLSDSHYQLQLQRISEWARTTKTGDIAEVVGVPEDSLVWGFVTSNEEFCSAHEFEELADCFVHHARQQAQESDIVVVNHHLLCADLALKDGGFGELLPTATAFIIDEAHQLPDIAAQFFGKRLSSRQLLDLALDTEGEQINEAPDHVELRELAHGSLLRVRVACNVNSSVCSRYSPRLKRHWARSPQEVKGLKVVTVAHNSMQPHYSVLLKIQPMVNMCIGLKRFVPALV